MEEQQQKIDFSLENTVKAINSWNVKSKRAEEQIQKQRKINMKKKVPGKPEYLNLGVSTLADYLEGSFDQENTNVQNNFEDSFFRQEFENKLNLTLKTILL